VKQPKAPLARRAHTIGEFDARYSLTPEIRRQLEKQGRGPAIIELARNVRIVTVEEEPVWLQRLGAVKLPPDPPALERSAFSIEEFVWRNGISPSLFYSLLRQGRGPQVMVVAGNKRLISAEEELAWQRRMSRPTGQEAAHQKAERAKAHLHALRAGRLSAEGEHHVSKRRKAVSALQAECAALQQNRLEPAE
jgi:hypothetical protein